MEDKDLAQIHEEAHQKLIEELAERDSEIQEYQDVVQQLRKERRDMVNDMRYLRQRIHMWRFFCFFLLVVILAITCIVVKSFPPTVAEAADIVIAENEIEAETQEDPPVEIRALEPHPSIAAYDIEQEVQEDYENMLIEQALLARAHKIDDCLITYYCTEQYTHICGTGNGLTAMGNVVTAGVSCAVPTYIPLGSTIIIDWGDGDLEYRVADDRGGWVKGNHIDLAVTSHKEALEKGMDWATVYWCEE